MYVTFGQNEASNLNPTSTFHNTSVSSSNSLKIVTSPYSLSPFTLNMWRNWGWGPFPVPCLCGNWQDPSNLLDFCSSLNSCFPHIRCTYRGGSRILCKGGPEFCARVSERAKFGFLINYSCYVTAMPLLFDLASRVASVSLRSHVDRQLQSSLGGGEVNTQNRRICK